MPRSSGVWCACVVLGATLHAQGERPARRDPSIERLVADAASLPPEFEADALLRVSALPRVDNEWRRELLDTAYMRAYSAPEQHRRATTQQVPPDSRQGAQVFAYATALTRVTLQIRAVELMAFVDPQHARDLFEWIDLNVAPGACADPLVPSVDEYYTALARIARLAYRGNSAGGLNFFELYLWRAHLPSEMPAVSRAIERFPRNRDEAIYLEGLFRLILQGSTIDPPGFSSAALDITARMTDLQLADTEIGVPGTNLMDTLRTYLVAQLKTPRCADNVTAAAVPATFNAALRRAKAGPDVSPLAMDAARYPASVLGVSRIDMYWSTADAGRLHDAAVRVRGPGAAPYPLRVRRGAEWLLQADRLLTDVDQWSGKSEREERDYVYQKAVLYTWLLELIPRGQLRVRATRSFVEFLRRTETDVNRRVLWFAFVSRLLEMAHGSYRAEVLSAMEESHQPTLVVYARLERMSPERKP